MLKVKDAINSRTPEKTIKILEELQKKYDRSEK